MEQRDKTSSIEETPWSIDDLIAAAEKIISSNPGLFAPPESESSKELNVRLIRDYVVREFIPRPVRIGREARFGLEHLVQLLAVRLLLRSQKWSLPAIKASFATTTTEELLNGTLAPVKPLIETEYLRAAGANLNKSEVLTDRVRTPELNPAQLLIQQFKSRGSAKSASMDMALARMTAAHAWPNPAPRRTGGVSGKLHIEVGPGCEVVVDEQRIKTLTRKEVERLGEALKARLLDQMAR